MGNCLRDLNPEVYHLVTVRTLEAYLWMVPTEKLNQIIGGILARYQEMFGIILYAYTILGNHLHFALKTTAPNLDQFMENVLREIARRVNRRIGRRGYFWHRRYDDQVILTPEDLMEAFLYTVTNPVKHGLVAEVRSWPGLHSYHQVLDEKPRQYPFVHYSKEDERGRPIITFHTLKLTPLPQLAEVTKEERTQTLKTLIAERQAELVMHRRGSGLGFLGAKAIRSQPIGRKPITVSYAPRPICYTKNPEIRRAYRAERRLFRARYYDASERFRLGDFTTEFPPYCFKPPLHRVPRIGSG